VACAGVTVQPGDLVAGDSDGVVVIPPGIAVELLADAREQEQEEEFIATRVAAGERIEGLYPLGDRWRPAYQAWLAEREPGPVAEREPGPEAEREPGPEAERTP